MNLGVIAAVLFGVAAVGGLVLAIERLRGRPLPSLALAIVHGLVAASALVLLLVAVTSGALAGKATIALVLFVVAALGGFVLFAMHLRKKALPIPVMLVHAVVAVCGFVVLLLALGGM